MSGLRAVDALHDSNIEEAAVAFFLWEGRRVPYHQVVSVPPWKRKRHLVAIKKTFSNQPDGFLFSEINDTFLVGPDRKTGLLDARLFYREVCRVDGHGWVEPGDVRIHWFSLAAYVVAALAALGLLVWTTIGLFF